MTYEEFKAEFTKAFNHATVTYKPGQIGFSIANKRMSELADEYPEFEERIFAEEVAA